MGQHRWLLPFTYGLNMRAIAEVMSVADAAGATLVAVALIGIPTRPGNRGVCLEHIQQTKDFLEAVNAKAVRLGLTVERHEVVTRDAVGSLTMLISELHCDAIVLVSRKGKEIFLEVQQFTQVLDTPPAPLVLICLPECAERQSLWKRLLFRHGSMEEVRMALDRPSQSVRNPSEFRKENYRWKQPAL